MNRTSLLVWMLALIGPASLVSAQPLNSCPDQIGLFFDQEATENCRVIGPSESFTIYLVATISEPSGISGWELSIDFPPDAFVTSWDIAGGGINFSAAPDFSVGFTESMPWQPEMVLMTITGFSLTGNPIEWVLGPASVPSVFPERPAYLAGDNGQNVLPLFNSTGELGQGVSRVSLAMNPTQPCPLPEPLDLSMESAGTIVQPIAVDPGDILSISQLTMDGTDIGIALPVAALCSVEYGHYLSSDSTLTNQDLWLDGDVVEALGGGAIIPQADLVTPSVTPGWYYVGALGDPSDELSEADEGNNFISERVLISPPKLRPLAAPVPLTANGNQLALSDWALENHGGLASGAFRTGYYLSGDSLITSGDTLLDSEAIADLGSSQPIVLTGRTLTLPPGLTEGIHHVGGFGDDLDQVLEKNEEDNYVSTSFEYFDVGTSLPCTYAQAFGSALDFRPTSGLSGDWAAIGLQETQAHPSGAVQLYRRVGSIWQIDLAVTPSDGVAGDEFGRWVRLSGDRLFVASPWHDAAGVDAGAIYTYAFDGSSWNFEQKILPPAGLTLLGTAADGDVVVGIGGNGVLIYRWSGSSWALEQDLATIPTGQGRPVDVDGDLLVVGSGFEDPGDQSGRARIYRFDGSSWNLEQTLSASPPSFFDGFGHAVSVSGGRVVIGSPASVGPGALDIFERPASTWTVTHHESSSPCWDVELDGDDLLIARDANSSVAHYRFTGGSWLSTSLNSLAPGAAQGFGPGLAVDDGHALIPDHDDELAHFVELSGDCDGNGIGDLCEIQLDPALDQDANGVLDTCDVTAVPNEPAALPDRYALHQAAPNPFNPSTTIKYSLPTAGRVEIAIFDLAGRRVRTLAFEHVSAGTHSVEWHGRDDAGGRVASGVYLYRMTAGDFSETRRMVLLK